MRISRLNSKILAKNTKDNSLSRDALLDALQALYDECCIDPLQKNDPDIKQFVEAYRKAMVDLKMLRVNLSDFEVKALIGRGHYGEVYVVREKQTGDVYAMKSIKKSVYAREGKLMSKEERDIMAYGNSEWLTSLQYSFQDGSNLFFIMDYHPGGDLLGLLLRQGGTIPESAAVFYLSELVRFILICSIIFIALLSLIKYLVILLLFPWVEASN